MRLVNFGPAIGLVLGTIMAVMYMRSKRGKAQTGFEPLCILALAVLPPMVGGIISHVYGHRNEVPRASSLRMIEAVPPQVKPIEGERFIVQLAQLQPDGRWVVVAYSPAPHVRRWLYAFPRVPLPVGSDLRLVTATSRDRPGDGYSYLCWIPTTDGIWLASTEGDRLSVSMLTDVKLALK